MHTLTVTPNFSYALLDDEASLGVPSHREHEMVVLEVVVDFLLLGASSSSES
jgi:hypothetical protein